VQGLNNCDGMDGFISQQKGRHQRNVVCKKLETPAQKVQEIEKCLLSRNCG
jgi:hypothetical protein